MSEFNQAVRSIMTPVMDRYGLRNICDYGCGDGALLGMLADDIPQNGSLTGIDFFGSPDPMKTEIPDYPGVRFIDRRSAAFTTLTHTAELDLVVSVCALHHFKFPVRELRTIYSLIRPGGYLLLMDISFRNDSPALISKNLSSFVDEIRASCQGNVHRHHYTTAEAADLMLAFQGECIEKEEFELEETAAEKVEMTRQWLRRLERKRGRLTHEQPIFRQMLSPLYDLEALFLQQYGLAFRHYFRFLMQRPA